MTFDEAIDLAIKQANGEFQTKPITKLPKQEYINSKHIDWSSVKLSESGE